ncbi:hypothetical protein FH972_022887 [Carpinus fangiana]|uniref:Uncharacterized protein n=1 Tax=Carpinus fangiana TaxID=176857 RepID=A0A5N6KTV3_9ROSI|nr:hypothetical protein FH972_022887 [Carpinus fangiana]
MPRLPQENTQGTSSVGRHCLSGEPMLSSKTPKESIERVGTADSETAQDIPTPYARAHQLVAEEPTLPAVVRTRRLRESTTTVQCTPIHSRPADDRYDFAYNELNVTPLDEIAGFLWCAGFPDNIRHHIQQSSLGRKVVLTEDSSLHLVWRPGQIFIKPLPKWLLHFDTFNTLVWHPSPYQACLERRDYVRAAALGFLLSYTKLVCYESDLRLAQLHGLIPESVTFKAWVAFADAVATSEARTRVQPTPRYAYGELRLGRLDKIYAWHPRYFRTHFLTGYYQGADLYSTFLSRNSVWLLALFLWATVVLTALQVGLATTQGQSREMYVKAAWVIANMSLGFVAGGAAIMSVACLGAVLGYALIALRVKLVEYLRSEVKVNGLV